MQPQLRGERRRGVSVLDMERVTFENLGAVTFYGDDLIGLLDPQTGDVFTVEMTRVHVHMWVDESACSLPVDDLHGYRSLSMFGPFDPGGAREGGCGVPAHVDEPSPGS